MTGRESPITVRTTKRGPQSPRPAGGPHAAVSATVGTTARTNIDPHGRLSFDIGPPRLGASCCRRLRAPLILRLSAREASRKSTLPERGPPGWSGRSSLRIRRRDRKLGILKPVRNTRGDSLAQATALDCATKRDGRGAERGQYARPLQTHEDHRHRRTCHRERRAVGTAHLRGRRRDSPQHGARNG